MRTGDLLSVKAVRLNSKSQPHSSSRLNYILVGGIVILILSILPQQFLAGSYPAAKDGISQVAENPVPVASGTYNVKDYGATGDGETLDMQAINEAIEACNKAGGGTVWFPAGLYLTGTIQLRSNTTLYLTAGATILGSKRLQDYYLPSTGERVNTLLIGEGLHNIAITGHGTIDGNKVTNPEGGEGYRGPHLITLRRCENILIQDISILDAGNWAHRLQDCSNGKIRGVTVKGGSDGVHLIDCKDFIITGCQFQTGDDCVAGGGWENVVVSNSILSTSCNGVKNVLQYGGMKNVVLKNLVIKGPCLYPHIVSGRHDLLAGIIVFQSGTVDNLVISDISISNVRCPFWIGGNPQEGASIRNISISNLTATGVGMPDTLVSMIAGMPYNPLENISLSNVTIISKGGGKKNLIGKPVPTDVWRPYRSKPAYGLFCRHVKNLELHDVRLRYMEEDARPAVICESIDMLELDDVHAQPGTGSSVAIQLKDIKKLITRDTEVQ